MPAHVTHPGNTGAVLTEREVYRYLKAAYKQVPLLLEQGSWFTHSILFLYHLLHMPSITASALELLLFTHSTTRLG